MTEPVKITISGVLEALEQGFTRNAGDPNYKGEGQSIGEKYGLNKSQVALLFKHDKLKGKKVLESQDAATHAKDKYDGITKSATDGNLKLVLENTNNPQFSILNFYFLFIF